MIGEWGEDHSVINGLTSDEIWGSTDITDDIYEYSDGLGAGFSMLLAWSTKTRVTHAMRG